MKMVEGPSSVMSRGSERSGALQEGRSLCKGLPSDPFEVAGVALGVIQAPLRLLYDRLELNVQFLISLHAALPLSPVELPSIKVLPARLLAGQLNFVHDPRFVLIRLHIHVFFDLDVFTGRLLLYQYRLVFIELIGDLPK